jgi:hypothetical protein
MERDSESGRKAVVTTSSALSAVVLDAAKIITWLGASIGGFAVILGTLGYLVIYSHDLLLGINVGLREPLQYVTIGGTFLEETGWLGIVKNGLTYYLLPYLLVLATLFATYTKLRNKKRLFALSQDVALAGLIVLQIISLRRLVNTLKSLGLLVYRIEGSEINTLLINDDFAGLRHRYGSIAAPVLLTILTLGYWWWKSAIQNGDWTYFIRHRSSVKILALLLTLMCMYGLPLIFGVLIMHNDYPLLTSYGLKDKEGDPFPNYKLSNNCHSNLPSDDTSERKIFLLNQGERDLVFYDRSRLQIVYLRRDAVSHIHLGQDCNVFSGRGAPIEYSQ